MNIFDVINSVLFNKAEIEITDEYNPYMTTRWVSMHSPELAQLLNESVNQLTSLSKDEHYKFLLYLLPRCKRCKLNYIKKSKEKEFSKEKEDNLAILSKIRELSQREIRNNMELLKYLNDIKNVSEIDS